MSDIRANTISDTSGNGPINLRGQSAAKAWINFDGDIADGNSNTIGVRDSMNISSLVNTATGSNDISYTNSFANVNYATTLGSNASSPYFSNAGNTYKANKMRIITAAGSTSTLTDATLVTSMAVGDLA